jgi:hypothetical protein
MSMFGFDLRPGQLENHDLPRRLRCDRIDAPVFAGPINGFSFTTYVETFLVPTLRPGDVIILENLSSHKGKAARRAIRATGAQLLLLPP